MLKIIGKKIILKDKELKSKTKGKYNANIKLGIILFWSQSWSCFSHVLKRKETH